MQYGRGMEPTLEALPEDCHRAIAVVTHADDLEYGAASSAGPVLGVELAITFELAPT